MYILQCIPYKIYIHFVWYALERDLFMDELSNHTIEHVAFKMTERHYPRPIGWNAKVGPHGRSRKVNTCTLITDQGVSGWGYCGLGEDEIRIKHFNDNLDRYLFEKSCE